MSDLKWAQECCLSLVYLAPRHWHSWVGADNVFPQGIHRPGWLPTSASDHILKPHALKVLYIIYRRVRIVGPIPKRTETDRKVKNK